MFIELYLKDPAIAAVFGAVCTGMVQFVVSLVLNSINRKSLASDLRTVIHDNLSEDVFYFKELINHHQKGTINVQYDYIQKLLSNNWYISSLKNDMYLFKNRELKKDIDYYLFNKNRLLQDIQILRRINYETLSQDQYHASSLLISDKIVELQNLLRESEQLISRLQIIL
jgi:hypothetical protein